jgi:sodium transport system ATP-binding protein
MESILRVDHLTKHFNAFPAIDDINFEARQGEIFGLLGPNGAGKTTTLRVIATTLSPTSGTALIAGFDIVRAPEEVKKRIGVLTTDIGVYERFSGRENLRYFGELYGLGGEALERRIKDLGSLLDMEAFLDRRAGKYSTGMKQKLAIARSVIHDPEVIIFDEPTSGLDVLASQTVLNFMKRMREQGKCVVLSTHQMPDAERLCDRVGIIHQGRLLVVDTIPAIEAQTKTSNLEDAFLALVGKSAQASSVRPGEVKQSRRFSLPSQKTLRLAIYASVAVFFLFQYVPTLKPVSPIGYGFLGLGLALSILDRLVHRAR